MTDPPRQPKQKAATVIAFFLVAAAALFSAVAAFGIYTPNQWTAAVQQRTAQDFDTAADIYGGKSGRRGG